MPDAGHEQRLPDDTEHLHRPVERAPGRGWPRPRPSGMPMTTVITSAEPVSSIVHGNRDISTSLTGSDWLNDMPRLPCTSWPRYFTYCTGRDWSSPYCSSSSPGASGASMSVLATAVAGSPGSRRSNRNVTVTANQW